MGKKKENAYKDIKLNKTQQRVFDYIMKNKSITSIDAFVDLGETRLSARIYELRRLGIPVSSQVIEVSNRFGEKRHVSKYYIG